MTALTALNLFALWLAEQEWALVEDPQGTPEIQLRDHEQRILAVLVEGSDLDLDEEGRYYGMGILPHAPALLRGLCRIFEATRDEPPEKAAALARSLSYALIQRASGQQPGELTKALHQAAASAHQDPDKK